MAELRAIDLVALAVVTVAAFRGLFLGLIREAFSIGALAAAAFAVRVWVHPLAAWLVRESDARIDAAVAPWLAGAAIAVGVVAAVGLFGRLIRGGARAVGLGWADRAGGAALGVVEGAIAVGLLFFVVSGVIGRHHTLLASSRSFAVFQEVVRVSGVDPPWVEDVAAEPPRS